MTTGLYRSTVPHLRVDYGVSGLAEYPADIEIHVVLDNLNTHKPKHDHWVACHRNVHFHFTPTHASWLNQVEVRFSLLSRAALRSASFTNPWGVRDAIDAYIKAYNPRATPFKWRKEVVHAVTLQSRKNAAYAVPRLHASTSDLLPDHRAPIAARTDDAAASANSRDRPLRAALRERARCTRRR